MEQEWDASGSPHQSSPIPFPSLPPRMRVEGGIFIIRQEMGAESIPAGPKRMDRRMGVSEWDMGGGEENQQALRVKGAIPAPYPVVQLVNCHSRRLKFLFSAGARGGGL